MKYQLQRIVPKTLKIQIRIKKKTQFIYDDFPVKMGT